jgi:hypothetical protein
MKKALDEAKAAFEQEEIPIGAVVVYENKIIEMNNISSLNIPCIDSYENNLVCTSGKIIFYWSFN